MTKAPGPGKYVDARYKPKTKGMPFRTQDSHYRTCPLPEIFFVDFSPRPLCRSSSITDNEPFAQSGDTPFRERKQRLALLKKFPNKEDPMLTDPAPNFYRCVPNLFVLCFFLHEAKQILITLRPCSDQKPHS